ncbi:c-type cytochrome [Novosphingobium malaysiense]|uniref:Cytochrome C-552 n=1 Tax=Novosphingobium malaysiense TaxID=1348853 RepID=A0A0B1ZGI4_9SPHN|nr:cytochrome c [Novosphingobium malaysiense]KHK90196.1 cytochrome C-552 [Novosphingobium malaysiense]
MPDKVSKLSRIVLVAAGLLPAVHASSAHADGAEVYSSRCSACHKADGAGVLGQFPRLKGRVGQIATSKDGRSYLISVLLYGIFGAVSVDGRQLNGMMPPMGSLSDQDIADTLNFTVALEKPGKKIAAFTAAEVKHVRNAGRLSAAQVAKQRAALAAKGAIP